MPTQNLNVKLNLVGFNADSTDKFTKQLVTINRMNAVQNRLKYEWDVGEHVHNCQVHFVISSPLPSYLQNSKDPIITNQSFDLDNVIPCPHPVTTFDLIDILAYIESVLPEPNHKTHWASTTNKTNDEANSPQNVLQNDTKSVFKMYPSKSDVTESIKIPVPSIDTTVKSESLIEDKPTFYAYGSFQKPVSEMQKSEAKDDVDLNSEKIENNEYINTASNRFSELASQWMSQKETITNTSLNGGGHVNLAETNVVEPTEAPKKDTFIRYGAFKDTSKESSTLTAQTNGVLNVTASGLKDDAPIEITVETPITETVTTTSESQDINLDLAIEINTEEQITDVWGVLSENQTGMIGIESLNIYVDHNNKIIHTACGNINELARLLFSPSKEKANVVTIIPSALKKFPLHATLWSYGLHHPHYETLTAQMNLDNQEWKLKGFPRFGQWETHPTWLFLATFFAQSHQSIYAAQAKGKASADQIKHFIYAAQLAGLTWQTQALDEDKKQAQLKVLQQQSVTEESTWVTRLRQKLQINEHFESSVD